MCTQCAARSATRNATTFVRPVARPAIGAVESVPFAVAPVSMLAGVLVGFGLMWFLTRKKS
jgi:hypothetical protein